MFINIKLKTERDNTMNKTIITVVGKDTVGTEVSIFPDS